MNKKWFLCLLLALYSFSAFAQQNQEKVRFIFATDVHLNLNNREKRDWYTGFKQALNKMKASKADFVIFGGDLVDINGIRDFVDSNGIPYKLYMQEPKQLTDSIYRIFKQMVDETKLRYYATIGNHDRYYDKDSGYVGGDEIFKVYFKESYCTFEEKGVRFFVLNSVQNEAAKDIFRADKIATGKDDFYVGEQQLEWLKNELSKVSASTPIVVSMHVPVYSLYSPVVDEKYVFAEVIINFNELVKVFENHNLKLVLQGHQHIYEEIFVKNVRYITAGAVSGAWWYGPLHGTEPGFLIVEIDSAGDFTWEYVDFGWIAKE